MADVVFINPRTHGDIKNVTTRLPLAALYIGSVLKKEGFSFQLIDQRVDDHWASTLHEALRERPLWVGLTSMMGRQIQWGLAASQIVREVDPSIPIVWGGVHPTILPDQTVSHLLVDRVVVWEGELTSLEPSKALRDGEAERDNARGGPHARHPQAPGTRLGGPSRQLAGATRPGTCSYRRVTPDCLPQVCGLRSKVMRGPSPSRRGHSSYCRATG